MRKVICLTFVGLILLSGCSKSTAYNSEEAVKKGDVVFTPAGIKNFNRFKDFLDNMEAHQKDKIRVTGYTDEGDPIYSDLDYDGNKIKYSHDNSNDKFGGDRGITTNTCKKIVTKETVDNGVDYHLSDCTKAPKDAIDDIGDEPYLFTKYK
ncbi:DUF4362 domain-containing protein [Bacillus sp. MUM 13]|uniref:DUF4362 domain-containing protein n=1 Tax=Bacillus sp. MUM 13 TaxID=1678001 RepID=UPI0008F5CF7D|nr:DUF4362 domain-containing protein [Bacillus sp. MUM 13]OIK13777.1 hypothetical protein BIV59_04780 [Bacillus sp. MUM 13]